MSNIRRIKRRPDPRHQRPYIQAQVRQLREAEDALLDALTGIEAGVYSDEVWCAAVGHIHELRAIVGDTQWRIFRACGYSLKVLRKLRER